MNGSSIYEFTADENWTLVDSQSGSCVYGYGNGELTPLIPGEFTDVLTTEMTMKDITNAEYRD